MLLAMLMTPLWVGAIHLEMVLCYQFPFVTQIEKIAERGRAFGANR